MQLYNHQQKLIDLNPKKYLIAHDRGTGKTLTALTLCKINKVKALIIVPKSIKQQWKENPLVVERGHTVVTKEEFRRDWEDIGYYTAIVIDECHYFAGMTSTMSKNLQKYLKRYKPPCVWLLTGTPYMSSVWNIFALARHLGHEWNYWTFRQRFFYEVQMGARRVPIQKTGIEEEVKQLVDSIGETVLLEDCVDMPEQVYEVEYIPITKQQEKAIMELDEPVHIVRWTKTHQIMGGTLKGDGYTDDKLIKNNKLERLIELVDEHKRSIVVCRYNNEIAVLAEAVRESGRPTYVINGAVDNREDIVKKLQGEGEYCLIVNASCSEGWQLGDCPVMIFYSQTFSLKDQLQMEARIRRIDKLKKNLYIFLVIKNTIDEDVYKCLSGKKDFHIAIYNK